MKKPREKNRQSDRMECKLNVNAPRVDIQLASCFSSEFSAILTENLKTLKEKHGLHRPVATPMALTRDSQHILASSTLTGIRLFQLT